MSESAPRQSAAAKARKGVTAEGGRAKRAAKTTKRVKQEREEAKMGVVPYEDFVEQVTASAPIRFGNSLCMGAWRSGGAVRFNQRVATLQQVRYNDRFPPASASFQVRFLAAQDEINAYLLDAIRTLRNISEGEPLGPVEFLELELENHREYDRKAGVFKILMPGADKPITLTKAMAKAVATADVDWDQEWKYSFEAVPRFSTYGGKLVVKWRIRSATLECPAMCVDTVQPLITRAPKKAKPAAAAPVEDEEMADDELLAGVEES